MVNFPAVNPKNANEAVDGASADNKTPEKQQESSAEETQQEPNSFFILSEKRKALFEPLEPVSNANGKRPSAESLLPPPDFESASYPKGWLIGKKRKLVNVDVVESMRRIAVQEMNRKVMFLSHFIKRIIPYIINDYGLKAWWKNTIYECQTKLMRKLKFWPRLIIICDGFSCG